MKTSRLYSIADKDGIKVDRTELKENASVSLNLAGNLFVALDNGLTGAQERVCLAHELGHCETMSFYNMYSPCDVRGKHERRANRWAIKKLVPRTQYIQALKRGYTDIYSLADYFDVTADFMQKAVDFYKTQQ